MGAASDERRVKIVRMLIGLVESVLRDINTGNYGFDTAIKAYVEATDNELSRAFQAFVDAVKLNDEAAREKLHDELGSFNEIRREVLHKIAEQIDVPELTAWVVAILKSQDEEISLRVTLAQQAALLREAL